MIGQALGGAPLGYEPLAISAVPGTANIPGAAAGGGVGSFSSNVTTNAISGVGATGAPSFSRASSATYIDANGAMQLAPNDVLRTDHSPAAPYPALGHLVEPASTNVLTNGNTPTFGNQGSGTVATTSDIAALYSAANVYKHTCLVNSGDNNTGALGVAIPTSGVSYVASFYLYVPSAFVGTSIGISYEGGGLSGGGSADLSKRDQWQRMSCQGTASSTASTNIVLRIATSSQPQVVYTSCWSSELSSALTSYIPTSGSAASRAADVYSEPSSYGPTQLSFTPVGTSATTGVGTFGFMASGNAAFSGVSATTAIASGTTSTKQTLSGVSATGAASSVTTSSVITAGISNIHIGLSAWAPNHSYSLGARVANGGNAYQCITAGTSAASGGPSGTGTSINDNAAQWKYLSAIDFTSVQAWANGIPGAPAVLTQPYIGYLWNDGPVVWTDSNTAILSLNNHNTSSANTITLKCAPGESIRDALKAGTTAFAFNSSKGVSFTLPSTPGNGGYGANYFDISDANVIIDGIQFKDPLSTSVSSIINVGSSGSLTVSDCIFDGYGQANGTAIIGANNTLKLRNCLIVDRQGATDNAVSVIATGASSYSVNNTFVSINNTNGAGFLVNSAAIARNTIFFGYLSGVGGNGNLVQADHCLFTASNVGFGTDSGNNKFSISQTNQFVSNTTDFRLLAASDAIRNGTVDTTDIPSADDLTGYARPNTSWSIGAWEARPLIAGTSALSAAGSLSSSVLLALVGVSATSASSSPTTTASPTLVIFGVGTSVSAGGFTTEIDTSVISSLAATQIGTLNALITGLPIGTTASTATGLVAPAGSGSQALVGLSSSGTATALTSTASGNAQIISGAGASSGAGSFTSFGVSANVSGAMAGGNPGTLTSNDFAASSSAGAQGQAGTLSGFVQPAIPTGASGATSVGSLLGDPGGQSVGRSATTAVGVFTTSSVIATAVSNIHVGLTGWRASFGYSVGDRVSNGSPAQAYQCIIAGTSGSSGPSGTASDIADNSVHWKWLSTVDFTTVQAWANAIPVTLTQPVVGYMWHDGAISLTAAGTQFLSLSGHVTTTINTITLTCAAGESFRDSLAGNNSALAFSAGAGVSITLPAGTGNTNYIDIGDTNVIIDGLQFRDPYSSSNSSIINAASNTNVLIRNCIFDGYAQANGTAIVGSNGTLQFFNCLVVDRQGVSDGAWAVYAASASSYAVNCTFVSTNNSNGAGFLVNYAATARNNIFVGYLNGIGGNGNLVLADHCIFTASNVGFGTDNGNNKFNINAANQFVSLGSDFRLSYASDALDAAATDLTDLPSATDIVGRHRPQGGKWDIGAWELPPLITGSGVVATLSVGTLLGAVSQAIVGTNAIGQAGTVGIIAAISANATPIGVSASGSATATSIISAPLLTGIAASGIAGPTGISIPGSVTISGLPSLGSAGSFSTSVVLPPLVGVSANAAVTSAIASPGGSPLGVTAIGATTTPSPLQTTYAVQGISGLSNAASLKALIAPGISGTSANGTATTPATSNLVAAATSNIHVGLAAWVSGQSYTVGSRVSNFGSAYQCIIAGTAGVSGPAGNGSNIPDGSVHWKFLSVVDFVSPQEWANSIPATLAQPYIGYMWNNGPITPPAAQIYLSLNNHATSTTNTITLTCAAGESFRDTLSNHTTPFAFNAANGVALTFPNVTSNTNYFDISDANVIIDGLQFQDPNPTSNGSIIQGEAGSTNLVIQNCIIDGYGQGGGSSIIGSLEKVIVRNNLIVDRQSTASAGVTIQLTSTALNSIILNNTIVSTTNNTGGVALLVNASSVIQVNRNNYYMGFTTPITGSGGAVVPTDHCCFSQPNFGYLNNAAIDNGNNRLGRSASNQFVNSTTDFRTKYSSDGLDAGATDTTDLPGATDIAKLARPAGSAWDIGAWELLPLVTGNGVGANANVSSLVAMPGGSIAGSQANAVANPVTVIGSINSAPSITGVGATGGASMPAAFNLSANLVGVTANGQASGPSTSVPGAVTAQSVGAAIQAGTLTMATTLNALTGVTASAVASSIVGLPGASLIGVSATGLTTPPPVAAPAANAFSSLANTATGSLQLALTRGLTGASSTGRGGSVLTSNVIAALTANIHIGLAGWQSNHPYGLGARIINSGNAYKCVQGGTSGSASAPVGTGTNIADGSTQWQYLSRVDFTDLQSWANAIPVTLTQPYIGYVWNDGPVLWTDSTTPVLSLAGHTTTTTNSITLTCAPGESIRDSLADAGTPFAFNSSLGVSITLPSTPGNGGAGINYVTVSDANVIIDGLQFKDPLSNSNCSIVFGAAGTNLRVQNCIFDGYAQINGAAIVEGDTLRLVNCLVVDRQGATDGAYGVIATTASSYAVNSTLVSINNSSGAGFLSNAAAIVRNCLITGYATPVGGSGSVVLVDHCVVTASSLAFATDNGHNIFNAKTVNQFLSVSNDFRLSYASDAVNTASTDLTDLPAATDIAGTARPQAGAWDIGAWELIPLVSGSGVAGVATIGSINPTVGGQISGVSAIASNSTITVYTGTNATVGITGLNATTATAALASSPQAIISGISGVATIGPVAGNVPGSAATFGATSIGSAGTISGSVSAFVVGTTATTATGSLISASPFPITGAIAAAACGTFSTSLASGLSGAGSVTTTGSLRSTTAAIFVGISAHATVSTGLTFSNTVAAATSNIHIGLSVWTTTTVYHLGDRVSNAGKAYRCVQAGTSASAPTGTGTAINDGSVIWKFLSAIDFTDLHSWANSIPTTLAQPYIGYLWNDAPITTTAGTQLLVLSGHTTTPTFSITVTCAPGDSFRDTLANHTTAFAFNSNNGVSIVLPNSAGTTNYFSISDANVLIDGIQFRDPCPTSVSSIIRNEAGATNLIVQNCIIDGYAQTNVGIVEGGDQIILRNNLIVDRQGSTDGAFAMPVYGTGSVLINNTIVSVNNSTNGAALIVNTAGVVTVNRNNYFMGYSTPIGGNSGTVVPTDHCCFSTATLTYLNSSIINNGGNLVGRSMANQFVNPSSDFRLSYAADGLGAASTDLTDLPTAADISRTMRPQGNAWDIGAWELLPFVSGAGVGATGTAGPLPTSIQIAISGGSAGAVAGSLVYSASGPVTGASAIATSGVINVPGNIGLSGANPAAAIAGQLATASDGSTLMTGASANAASSTIIASPGGRLIGITGSSGAGAVTTSSVIAAIVANIHVGLPNWVTGHSYTIGNRVARNGNAYQCSSAGISSSGPSGTGSSIADGTAVFKFLSAIDFTSVQAWGSALPATLTVPMIGQIWNDGTITTTAGVPFLSLQNHSTSTANTITLTCAPGESFRDTLSNRNTAFAFNSANGVSFMLPTGAGNMNYFDIYDANVIIDGLQIKDPNPTSNATLIQGEATGNNLIIQNCIVDGYAQPGGASIIGSVATYIVRNTLVVDRQASNGTGAAIVATGGTNSIFINNTIVSINNNTTGLALQANTATSVSVNRNNYFLNYAVPIAGSGGATVPTDHCCFSVANAVYTYSAIIDNGGNIFNANINNQFLNPATDFRTGYAADGLDRAYTDITDLPGLADISKLARPQGSAWDIGAWELLPIASGMGAAAGSGIGLLTTFASGATSPTSGASASGGTSSFTVATTLQIVGAVAAGQAGSLSESITAKFSIAPAASGQANALSAGVTGYPLGVPATGQTTSPIMASTVGLLAPNATGSAGVLSTPAAYFVSLAGIQTSGVAGPISTNFQFSPLTGLQATASANSIADTIFANTLGTVATGQTSAPGVVTNATIAFGVTANATVGPAIATVNTNLTGSSAVAQSGLLLLIASPLGISASATIATLSGQIDFTFSGAAAITAIGTVGTAAINTVASPSINASATIGALRPQLQAGPAGIAATASTGIASTALLYSLIGIAGTTQLGNVAAQITTPGAISIIGVSAASQIGIPVSTLSLSLGSGSATATAASLQSITAVPLSGLSAQTAISPIVPTLSAMISGTSATITAGVISIAAFAGSVNAIAMAGTLRTSQLIALRGGRATVGAGNIVPLLNATVTGTSSVTAIGTLQSPGVSPYLIGSEAVSIVGVFGGPILTLPSLNGVTASSTLASLLAQASVNPLGLASQGVANPVALYRTVSLSGLSSTALLGALAPTLMQSMSGQIAYATAGALESVALLVGRGAVSATGLLGLRPGGIPAGVQASISPAFRRASGGTYYDATGTLQYAFNDTPRWDHSPMAPFAPVGLLLEGASSNLMPQSDFANWVTADAATLVSGFQSPDGTNNALFLRAANGTGVYDASYAWGGSANTVYTHSVWAKANGFNYLHMQTADANGSSSIEAWFDLTNGSVVSVSNSGSESSGASARVIAGSNGFYRCVLTGIAATNPNLNLRSVLRISATGNDNTIVGDGVSGVILFGDQIEQSPTVSSYIPTTGTVASRAMDIAATGLNSRTTIGLMGVTGGATVSPVVPQPAGAGHISGTLATSTIGTVALRLSPNLAGVSGGAMIAALGHTIPAVINGVLSVASVNALVSNVVGVIAGLNATSAIGAMSELKATIQLSGIAGKALIALPIAQPSGAALLGLSANTQIGAINYLDVRPFLTGLSAVSGSGHLQPEVITSALSGVAANTDLNIIGQRIGISLIGVSASNATGSLSMGTASVSGTRAVVQTGSLRANGIISLFSAPIAVATAGSCANTNTISLAGTSATTTLGSLAYSLDTAVHGAMASAHCGTMSALATVALSGILANATVGSPRPDQTRGVTGCTTTVKSGVLQAQGAVFPPGIAANATANAIKTNDAVMTGSASASARSGSFADFQIFALAIDAGMRAGIGRLSGQTTIFLTGQGATASCGSVNLVTGAVLTGLISHGRATMLTTAHTASVSTTQASTSVGSLVPEVAAFPFSVAAVGRASMPGLQVTAAPLSASGVGIAGITYGWLIIVNGASTIAAPRINALVTAGAVMDEEPIEVSVFAVPQVIQVVYPVVPGAGYMVEVFSIPQLLNTVINDG